MIKRLAVLLALILLLAAALAGCGERPSQEQLPEGNGAKPGDEAQADDEEYISISVSDLKKYISDSSSVMELAQRFFTDTIVYKDAAGQYKFEPVNKTLPLSDYNWDNLRNLSITGKEFVYEEDGQVRSIKGIDVSRYQSDIDWEKVAGDGVEFVMVRVGYRGYLEGKIVLDEKFEEHVEGALRHGIKVGVYFVTQALTEEEAVEEANFVLDAIAPFNISWPVVLDIEEAASTTARTVGLSAQKRTDNAIAFCETVKQAGYTPMLYCNIRWYMDELELDRLPAYEKWFAQYFNRPFFPYDFGMWQYTNTGRVNGISGNVDLNISMKDYSKKE
ncbi:MAG: glycoside hydrolase family 25 protein [Firmicutes bacterium]|nr:glycoside hydrolase family 25 protein [Bacillota bacterium]